MWRVELVLAAVSMQPPFLPSEEMNMKTMRTTICEMDAVLGIDFGPDVVGPIHDISRLVAESTTEQSEAIRPLTTTATPSLQQLGSYETRGVNNPCTPTEQQKAHDRCSAGSA